MYIDVFRFGESFTYVISENVHQHTHIWRTQFPGMFRSDVQCNVIYYIDNKHYSYLNCQLQYAE